jgi:threonine synthase
MRGVIEGRAFTDDEVRAGVREVWDRYGYVCDPHTAIAYLGATRCAADTAAPRIFLATAHPAKCREVVEPVQGRLVPLPPALAAALARPRQVVRIAAEEFGAGGGAHGSGMTGVSGPRSPCVDTWLIKGRGLGWLTHDQW